MGIFDRFPYSSTHEMNLDFMLGKATEIAEDMQQVTAGMEQVQAGLSAISEKTEQATQAAAQAAQSASSIEGSVTAAEEAAEEAQMHNESAQTWANNAMTYKADCQRAATEAAASSSSAAQAATAAAASEDTVATYAQAANASAQSAANNNDSAHQYANQASASASNATFHSSNAQTAATNANTSATNAETAATNAQTAATRTAALKDDCETLHRMCTAAVDQASTEAVNAANSAAQAAATKTDVENLVESLPEDFTDLNNTVNQLSDEIVGVKSTLASNTVITWNQLAKLANDWTMNWGTGTVTKGNDEFIVENAPANHYAFNGVSGNMQPNHKYLFMAYAKATNAKAGLHFDVSNNPIDVLTDSNDYVLLSAMDTATRNESFSYYATLVCRSSNSETIAFKHPKMFDLTMMGLENITVNEFISMFPDWENAEQNTSGTVTTLSNFDVLQNEIFNLSPSFSLSHKVFLLCGDSRASTDYTFYKSTLERKTNGTAVVLGGSGWTTKMIASNSYFNRLTRNSAHDYAFFLVGGNDTGESGTVGTFSATSPNGQAGEPVVQESDLSHDFYTGSGVEPDYSANVHQSNYFIVAVDHIIRKYKSIFYNFKTLNNGHKPKIIFLTDLPQQRVNSASAYSIPANWERKRQAIIEACEKNDVDYIDTMVKCNFDMSYEPFYTSPTNFVDDNGVYYMDGLHPNQYGIDVITSLEVEEMKKYISINPYLST